MQSEKLNGKDYKVVVSILIKMFSGCLDIHAFERLLGPCKQLLERNIDLYAAELDQTLNT